MKKRNLAIIATVIIAVLIVSTYLYAVNSNLIPAQGFGTSKTTLESKPTKAAPTINGIIENEEYADATKITADSINAIVYIKNDNNFAYIAIDASNSSAIDVREEFDLSVLFNTSANQTLLPNTGSDYDIIIRMNQDRTINFTVRHLVYTNEPLTLIMNGWQVMHEKDFGSSNTGTLSTLEVSWTAGAHRIYEMKIPLQGEYGINAKPGDTIGITIARVENIKTKITAHTWPATANTKDPASWNLLKLAAAT